MVFFVDHCQLPYPPLLSMVPPTLENVVCRLLHSKVIDGVKFRDGIEVNSKTDDSRSAA